VAVNGIVYVGGEDKDVSHGRLLAIDVATGREVWRYEANSAVWCSPAVANGLVYFGDRDLHAVDALTGEEVWRTSVHIGYSAPAVVNGVVYVGSQDASVTALDAATGAGRWRFETVHGVFNSPAVSDDLVFVNDGDIDDDTVSVLYAIDASTGTERWRFDLRSTGAQPTVAGGAVYVGCEDGVLHVQDANSGEERWTLSLDGPIDGAPAVVNSTVYVGGLLELYAFGDR
jgi:outer membrane protein assembly factor BamB